MKNGKVMEVCVALFLTTLIVLAFLAVSCSDGITSGIVENGETDIENGIVIDIGDEGNKVGNDINTGDEGNKAGNDIDNENDDDNGNSDNDGDSNDGEDEDDDGDTDTKDENDNNDSHSVIPLLTSTAEINEYLASHTGGASTNDPVCLNVQIDLGKMATDSNWPKLLAVLNTQGKYVSLDLSACTMGRADFAPRAIIAAAGKDRIVGITLPTAATSIATGSINTSAFSSFTNLSIVTLPENLVSIGDYAFYNRAALKTVIIHATTPPELGTNVFTNTHTTLQIHVPAESVEAYRNAEGWNDLANIIVPQVQ